jgi:hypothetical protein
MTSTKINAPLSTLTISQLKKKMTDDGSFWWSKENMRAFGTHIVSKVFSNNGVDHYFIAHEYDGPPDDLLFPMFKRSSQDAYTGQKKTAGSYSLYHYDSGTNEIRPVKIREGFDCRFSLNDITTYLSELMS